MRPTPRFAALVLLLVLAAAPCGCGEPPSTDEPQAEPQAEPPSIMERRAAFASADRERIDDVLARLAPVAGEREAGLREDLDHPDRGVREWSAHAIGEFRLDQEATIDALMRALDDPDDWVRWKAVRALGLIGPAASRALPRLDAAATAQQETEVVRAAAQVAVKAIRGGT